MAYSRSFLCNSNSTPLSILGKSDAFAWRANLYVSANPDGKLNKNDIIGSTQLPLVGSLLCTSSNNAANNGFTTYIQTNYTDAGRGSFSSSGITPGTLSYTLPTLKEFDPVDGIYTDTRKNKVAIADTNDIKLFEGQFKSPTNFDNTQKMHFIKNNILFNVKKIIPKNALRYRRFHSAKHYINKPKFCDFSQNFS